MGAIAPLGGFDVILYTIVGFLLHQMNISQS